MNAPSELTPTVRAYLESVVSVIEARHRRRGFTTGKKLWELRLLTEAKLLLATDPLTAMKQAPDPNQLPLALNPETTGVAQP